MNGSPLFTGQAGNGESNIRQWIIENDWLEAVIALPDQLFYNTGISTYICILNNRKSNERQGRIQLINAFFGYWRVTVEPPMTDENGKDILNRDGNLVLQTIEDYIEREVKPLRSLAKIKADILALKQNSLELEKTVLED